MDSTEDLSPRVLLKQILNVEQPRTPLTRSATAPSTSGLRRSSRLNKSVAVAQTPQSILRRSLKHKIQESVFRKSLPIKRRTTSSVLKNTNIPASTSVLNDEGTPRQLLKNILQTELDKTPVVHEHAESEDLQPQLPTANSSLESSNPSIELSGLELPDLTTGNIASTVKVLRRKRPRRSFNVSAFEKRFKEGNDIDEDESAGDHSSLSLSSTSLSLKTPFIDVRTEKKGLQRRVSNRRKINEEEFLAALNKNHPGVSALVPEQGLSETAYSEGFTLGLSKLSEPDITTDIINCNTALYTQTNDIMSNFSTLATEDKPTVVASQLEEQLDVKNNGTYLFPTEEKTLVDSQDDHQTEPADEDAAVTLQSQSEQEQSVEKLQSSNIEDPAESDKEPPQSEEADSQTEDDAAVSAHSEEDDAAEGQTEYQEEIDAQSGDEVSEKEESVVGQQRVQNVSVMSSRPEEEGNDSQKNYEDGEQKLDNLEYISRRAQCSESGLIMPITKIDGDLPDTTEAGYSDAKSKECIASDLHSHMDIECSEVSGLAESSTRKDASDSEAEQEQHNPPEDVTEEEEQSGDDYEDVEEEDNYDVPCKTPAFVKEKRNFFFSHPQASSSVKNIKSGDTGLPAAKPKQRIQRKPRSAKSEPGLPKSYLMNVFKHFAKTKVSADVYPVLKEIMDTFFDRLAKDLEAYALHARRSTIEVADGKLLLKRQGHVNDKVPVEVLIEKYLRMDQRKLLIPIATSGNEVIPKKL